MRRPIAFGLLMSLVAAVGGGHVKADEPPQGAARQHPASRRFRRQQNSLNRVHRVKSSPEPRRSSGG